MGEIHFSCPHCGAKLHVGDQYVGRAVKCAKCEQVSKAPAPMAGPAQGDGVVAAEDVTAARQNESFGTQLSRSFIYPFKGSGIFMLISATAIFVVLGLLSWIICAIAILQLFLSMYVWAYYISVIKSSAGGEEEPPDWPDLSNFWDDILRPLLLVAAALIVSAVPLIICGFIAVGWGFLGSIELMAAWVWIGVAVGLLYLPMSLLAIAMYDSVVALNPVTIIGSIVKIPLQYLMACVLFFLVFYVNGQIQAYMDQIPIAGAIGRIFLSLYMMMVASRILGLIYSANAKKLGWFEDK